MKTSTRPVAVTPSDAGRWPSWNTHTSAPNVAVRLSRFSTSALTGMTTLPVMMNSSTQRGQSDDGQCERDPGRAPQSTVSTTTAVVPATSILGSNAATDVGDQIFGLVPVGVLPGGDIEPGAVAGPASEPLVVRRSAAPRARRRRTRAPSRRGGRWPGSAARPPWRVTAASSSGSIHGVTTEIGLNRRGRSPGGASRPPACAGRCGRAAPGRRCGPGRRRGTAGRQHQQAVTPECPGHGWRITRGPDAPRTRRRGLRCWRCPLMRCPYRASSAGTTTTAATPAATTTATPA